MAALAVGLLLLCFHWIDGQFGISYHRNGKFFYVAMTTLPAVLVISFSSLAIGVIRAQSLASRYKIWISKSESIISAAGKILGAFGAILLIVFLALFLFYIAWGLTFVWPINRGL
ncbi:MAG: hypothetical protein KJ970_09280 [Candidatus Eisenbacteria bacterium]|uniref:Uncharacterized protein n=1 Tax=Eiseniibacteriota bacterium TaxID=2212470 RepID=A0A948RUH5_UNCEI|nr:hypothetical protein [Candidatus Eisenbacteria bacterium]